MDPKCLCMCGTRQLSHDTAVTRCVQHICLMIMMSECSAKGGNFVLRDLLRMQAWYVSLSNVSEWKIRNTALEVLTRHMVDE